MNIFSIIISALLAIILIALGFLSIELDKDYVYLLVLFFAITMPTYWFAKDLKKIFNKEKTIRALNITYFLISTFVMLILFVYEQLSGENLKSFLASYPVLFFLVCAYMISRCSEIGWAFLKDAYDTVKGKKDTKTDTLKTRAYRIDIKIIRAMLASKLFRLLYKNVSNTEVGMSDRLKLALRSYLELIINFAVLYALLPYEAWKDCTKDSCRVSRDHKRVF